MVDKTVAYLVERTAGEKVGCWAACLVVQSVDPLAAPTAVQMVDLTADQSVDNLVAS